MNSGQVWLIKRLWAGKRGRLGGVKDKLPPTTSQGWDGSVQREGRTRGDTVFRGLSGATLPTRNIYMHSSHWGQVGTWGMRDRQPSDGVSQAQSRPL